MRANEIRIPVYEYSSPEELNDTDRLLLQEARRMTGQTYSPYSGFKVGAAVRLQGGIIITGSNQENAAYPSGLCAERVALFYANANYPGVPVEAIAISALNHHGQLPELVTPCGACRQVMEETEVLFDKPIRIILDGDGIIRILEGMASLLPLSFSNRFL